MPEQSQLGFRLRRKTGQVDLGVNFGIPVPVDQEKA